jgi:lysine-N-methylase
MPRYVERFQCVGAECEDNCCTGWRVIIDRKTFDAYRQVDHPALRDRLQLGVRIMPHGDEKQAYAQLELQAGSLECPMMEGRLCSIQRELGEDMLSNTCFSYPRYPREFGGVHEQALTLSCPEAARLALLAPDAFEFVQAPIHLRDDQGVPVTPRQGCTVESMNDIRMFCFQLMRSRDLALWERLAILGVFCERLAALLSSTVEGSERSAEVSQLLLNMENMIRGGQASSALSGLLPDHDAQVMVLVNLWAVMKPSAPGHTRQARLQQAIADALGFSEGATEFDREVLLNRYQAGVRNLPAALAPAPWLMENYLLNEMFRELFPFGDSSVQDHYLRLVTRFGIVRLMLAAQCIDEDRRPTVQELAGTVQVFCRRYQHDDAFAAGASRVLRKAGWDGLEKLFRFLKA